MTYGNKFPFHSCKKSELENLFSDSVSPTINDDETSQHLAFVSDDEDHDHGIFLKPNCNNYNVHDFLNLKNSKNLNIYHNNLNGLENKIDILREFLVNVNPKFDIIAISETSEKIKTNFISNVNLSGYELFSTPSNSSKGGVALYINSNFNIIERVDLNSSSTHFESVWAEIKNVNSKNILCASIYRHPHNNNISLSSFFEYMEHTLSKISAENKDLYLCGDFNFNLLKTQNCHFSRHFYELLNSYGLIAQITTPSRTTESCSTIIDNMFTNNISNKKISGNILTDFSDHFSQFLSVEKILIDKKITKLFKRDFSNFSVESFRDDVSIQHFHNDFTDVN